jgi:hypothetical protein
MNSRKIQEKVGRGVSGDEAHPRNSTRLPAAVSTIFDIRGTVMVQFGDFFGASEKISWVVERGKGEIGRQLRNFDLAALASRGLTLTAEVSSRR